MAAPKDIIREAVTFLAINVGLSLLLRAGQAIWPDGPFRSIPIFLLTVGVILALNFQRAFVQQRAQYIYAAISVLNVLTTVGIGNSGFLTSVRSIARIISSLI
jgi:hypothetical protein